MFLSSPVKDSAARCEFLTFLSRLVIRHDRLSSSVDMYYVKKPEFLMLYYVK